MHAALVTALVGLSIGQTLPDNLDFRKGSLENWDGEGFALVGPGVGAGVTSSDDQSPTGKGMIRFVLTIPPGAKKIEFKAYAAHAEGSEPDHRLDVLLAGAGKRVIPKTVKTAHGWRSTATLLSRWESKPREYAWDVAGLEGQRVQIVIVDQDERPGSYVFCTGFTFVGSAPKTPPSDDFAQYMLSLQKKHQLAPMARFDSRRFTAYSNASERFTALRLRQCEILYDLFYDHFQKRGFALHQPKERLMLAVFDSPKGFDAYMGMKFAAGVTGLYHPATNRLILYDLSENKALLAQKNTALKEADKIPSAADRTRYVETVERKMDLTVKDVNLTTTMHEAAHQLSFNSGLLNRHGDLALWLAEGLACYCEATEQGEWQAIGAVNSDRVSDLVRARGKFIPLKVLVKEDWRTGAVLLGYAQSWALFRMLVQERPKEMRNYLTEIYSRRTPDYRLDDFRQAFGNDLNALEQQYFAYLRDLVEKHGPRR